MQVKKLTTNLKPVAMAAIATLVYHQAAAQGADSTNQLSLGLSAESTHTDNAFKNRAAALDERQDTLKAVLDGRWSNALVEANAGYDIEQRY